MKSYIGLDVSKEETAVCVINEDQKVVKEMMVKTNPEAIFKAISQMKLDHIECIGLESGSWSHWLTRELRMKGLPAKCYDARSVARVLELTINKTDQNDARGIALGIRSGFFKECQIKTPEQLSLGGMINLRKQLVEQRVELQNSIRGTLKPLGINMKSVSDKKFSSAVLIHIPVLPEVIGNAIVTTLECLDALMNGIEKLDEQLRKQTQFYPQVLKLMTVDGVGPITALAFFAEVGDPSRFKNVKAIGAYLGLTPTQYSSGEKEAYGRISKRGSAMLRGLLAQCALVLLTRTSKWSKLRSWGLKIQMKRGIQKAIVALSRKMAVTMLKMLIDETTFIRSDKETVA